MGYPEKLSIILLGTNIEIKCRNEIANISKYQMKKIYKYNICIRTSIKNYLGIEIELLQLILPVKL
jgi:hypothetical protein